MLHSMSNELEARPSPKKLRHCTNCHNRAYIAVFGSQFYPPIQREQRKIEALADGVPLVAAGSSNFQQWDLGGIYL